MTNAELIKALRCEKDCDDCAYHTDNAWSRCDEWGMRCDAADALEAAEKRIAELEAQEPTEKQVVDYCHKRCLVIVEGELFQRMKSTFSQRPKEGEWIDIKGTMFAECSVCGNRHYGCNTPYCDMCGAKMKGEQEETKCKE